MNPAERLLAAADLLDKRASEATAGPWTATVKDGGRAWVNTGEHDRAFSLHGWQADARYIATMHPEVGKLVAASMREAAYTIEGNARLVAQGRPTINIASAFLLDLADLVLVGGVE